MTEVPPYPFSYPNSDREKSHNASNGLRHGPQFHISRMLGLGPVGSSGGSGIKNWWFSSETAQDDES